MCVPENLNLHREPDVSPHQVCQVGLLSTHELPLLANGCHPAVDRFVEILPDIVLQVVSVVSPEERNHYLTPTSNHWLKNKKKL